MTTALRYANQTLNIIFGTAFIYDGRSKTEKNDADERQRRTIWMRVKQDGEEAI
ncbi:uncharacterized protein G2W53_020972 [Senna tora]|uniref:Uncharacterized protein n=1 Tax=Senna tora TaxID=362788 RepID=A0A834WJ63_9FABA|nr:uncharacterized protein G2W53_020972 [Senna tora]